LNVDCKKTQPQTHRGIPQQNREPIAQVMGSGSAVLGSCSESHWEYGKIQHENGLKC